MIGKRLLGLTVLALAAGCGLMIISFNTQAGLWLGEKLDPAAKEKIEDFKQIFVSSTPDLAVNQQWQEFKRVFVSPDGRIIDYKNNQISHSEGQGYGLLVAQYLGEREDFDLILNWSNTNLLTKPGNGLRAWSWGKRPDGSWGILDENNASDGDILHAWALFMAGEKWPDSTYKQQAFVILNSIRKDLIYNGYLLPGRKGFFTDHGVKLNLSYYIFSAFNEFARQDVKNQGLWKKLADNGHRLLLESITPESGLPPDWLNLLPSGKMIPPYNSLFGYEAIRIPIYVAWENDPAKLEIFRPYILKTAAAGQLPEFVNLNNGTFANTEASAGHYAVMARAAKGLGLTKQMKFFENKSKQLRQENEEDYYASILALLANIF